MTTTNQRRTQAEDEPVVPVIVAKPEEDKDDEVGLLDVPPGFAPRDGHAQPPVMQVWIWVFFTATWCMYCSSGFWGFLAE